MYKHEVESYLDKFWVRTSGQENKTNDTAM